jgi:hypothetical protein
MTAFNEGTPSRTATSKAKDVLLRALEQVEKAEEELGEEADRADLVVVYSIGRDDEGDGAWHEVGGWACTAGPKWMHAAMLRRAADAHDDAARSVNDGEEDDGDDDD